MSFEELFHGYKPSLRLTSVLIENADSPISIIRDDQILFGFGTKIRKIIGFLNYHSSKLEKEIWLWGSLHGNYLAAYSFYLARNNFQVHILSYTRDLNLKSANRMCTESSSISIQYFSKRIDALCEWEKIKSQSKDTNVFLPEFGFHFSAVSGLNQLWSQLEDQKRGKKTIFLEIGSGLTFLSALEFYQNTEIHICGISVGEKAVSFQKKMKDLQLSLGLNSEANTNHSILDPIGESKFGRSNTEERKIALDLYEKSGIFLEPVYGIKTWHYLMQPEHLPYNLPKPWVYLHQGGQLNHLDLLLDK